MAYDLELATRVRLALAERTDVTERRMFGGLAFMVRGHMCCGVLANDLVRRGVTRAQRAGQPSPSPLRMRNASANERTASLGLAKIAEMTETRRSR